MPVTLRRFIVSDAPAVSALIAKTLRVNNAKDYPPEAIDALARRHTPEYIIERASWTHFYVVCDGDTIIGCGAIGPYWNREDESCLFTIFVDPDHQGRGAGWLIMETLERDDYFLRARRVEIPASITARDFYLKFGYTYKNGNSQLDDERLYRLEKHRNIATQEAPMRLFDTHCHIADPRFDEDRAEVIQRFLDAGVQRALVVADPREDIPNEEKVFALIDQYPFLYGAIGVHPHNASGWDAAAEATVRRYLEHPKCRLLGEIGLDYHYDLSPRDVQREVFDVQLEMAFTLGKPVQLHIREAHGDCMDMLRARAKTGRLPSGIMHCYTGSWEAAKVYLDMGLYISLSGAVTFKNAPKLAEVARNTPADRLLIETDCPYMAPVPLRGRRNEPAYIVHTFEKVAELRGDTPEALSEQLWANACRILCLEA